MSEDVPILKDESQEHPVPSQWRPKLAEIVDALRDHNYRLAGLTGVEPLDELTASQIAAIVDDYGATITSLSNDTWGTSVCQWQLNRWELLIDLFTVEEGCSDLVLHVNVFEDADQPMFKVHFVYVP